MEDDDRPLVLVVCADPDRLLAMRRAIRQSGMWTAPARSVPAAISLLAQVQINACLLALDVSVEEADALWFALDGQPTARVRLHLTASPGELRYGWVRCDGDGYLDVLLRALQGPKPD